MLSLRQTLTLAVQQLQPSKTKIATLDAEILLSHILKKPKEYLYTHPEKILTRRQHAAFQKLIARRTKGEPIAYLVGHKEFFGLDFTINKNALIPRPETELLVEETLNQLPTTSSQLSAIADIGTGSGCIAVAIAKHAPKTKIYGTDVSAKTLALAKTNAHRHQVSHRITFLPGSLLAPLKNIKLDALVANLPYGWSNWKNNTSAETIGLRFEPPRALFTGERGLKLYRQFLKQMAKRQQQPRLMLLEFDPRQTKAFTKLIKQILPHYSLEIKKDLLGHNRLIILNLQQKCG
ncbi:peptide chain release factor N(5)-glutamine methyltransferase [Candidatus Falkowbacteria bacterium]|nr:peptide chain release factor N(5)-glutamine methyltransferase [Candidatus Falkowbacteria bacterium]